MKNYVCVKGFEVDLYDEAGFYQEESETVEPGSVWTLDESPDRMVGNADTLRLIQDGGLRWLELLPETVAEYFREGAARYDL